MRYWVEQRRLISNVQIKIALLILGVIAAGAVAIFYNYAVAR